MGFNARKIAKDICDFTLVMYVRGTGQARSNSNSISCTDPSNFLDCLR